MDAQPVGRRGSRFLITGLGVALLAGACGGGSGASPTDGAADAGGGGSDGASSGPAVTKRLVPGPAHILGTPNTACSQTMAGAAGSPLADHWCAFTLPGQNLGATDLWVIDVEAALGAAVKCDGSDAHCVRLSTNLWTAQPMTGPVHPFSHHFYGQTLIFYVGPATANAFSGPVMGWRPGWPEARQLTSDTAVSCDGYPASDVALCFDNEGFAGNPPHFDVRAGRLGTGPLPARATIYPRTATNASQWPAP